MTAEDIGALLGACRKSIDLIYEELEEAGTEFSEIRGHSLDSVWNTVDETP